MSRVPSLQLRVPSTPAFIQPTDRGGSELAGAAAGAGALVQGAAKFASELIKARDDTDLSLARQNAKTKLGDLERDLSQVPDPSERLEMLEAGVAAIGEESAGMVRGDAARKAFEEAYGDVAIPYSSRVKNGAQSRQIGMARAALDTENRSLAFESGHSDDPVQIAKNKKDSNEQIANAEGRIITSQEAVNKREEFDNRVKKIRGKREVAAALLALVDDPASVMDMAMENVAPDKRAQLQSSAITKMKIKDGDKVEADAVSDAEATLAEMRGVDASREESRISRQQIEQAFKDIPDEKRRIDLIKMYQSRIDSEAIANAVKRGEWELALSLTDESSLLESEKLRSIAMIGAAQGDDERDDNSELSVMQRANSERVDSMITDAVVNNKPLPTIEEITAMREDGELPVNDANRYLEKIARISDNQNKRAKSIAMVHAAIENGWPLSVGNKDHRDGVQAVYESEILTLPPGDDGALYIENTAELSRRTGIVPQGARDYVTAGLNSMDGMANLGAARLVMAIAGTEGNSFLSNQFDERELLISKTLNEIEKGRGPNAPGGVSVNELAIEARAQFNSAADAGSETKKTSWGIHKELVIGLALEKLNEDHGTKYQTIGEVPVDVETAITEAAQSEYLRTGTAASAVAAARQSVNQRFGRNKMVEGVPTGPKSLLARALAPAEINEFAEYDPVTVYAKPGSKGHWVRRQGGEEVAGFISANRELMRGIAPGLVDVVERYEEAQETVRRQFGGEPQFSEIHFVQGRRRDEELNKILRAIRFEPVGSSTRSFANGPQVRYNISYQEDETSEKVYLQSDTTGAPMLWRPDKEEWDKVPPQPEFLERRVFKTDSRGFLIPWKRGDEIKLIKNPRFKSNREDRENIEVLNRVPPVGLVSPGIF